MSKRAREVEHLIPGSSADKHALYEAAVSRPVELAAARTGLDLNVPTSDQLPYGCSLCLAPSRDASGAPSSALFVLDHVRRMAFELRQRSGRDGDLVAPSSVKTSSASPVSQAAASPKASRVPASPKPPAPTTQGPQHGETTSNSSSSRSRSPSQHGVKGGSTPPAFYEDVRRESSKAPVVVPTPVLVSPPPPSPLAALSSPSPQAPAGAASRAVPLDLRMPVDMLEKHRNALLYCHLCKVYIPPHVVNLEAHLNTRNMHQRVQDDLIAEAVKTGTLADPATGAILSVRDLANRQPRRAQRPPSLMVSDKNYEAVPTFINPRSAITDADRGEDPDLRGFWEAGLDVVFPYCTLCEEPVSLQLLAAHKKKPTHRERQKVESAMSILESH